MFRHVWEMFRHVLRCAKMRQTNNVSRRPYPSTAGSWIFLSFQDASASSGLIVFSNGGCLGSNCPGPGLNIIPAESTHMPSSFTDHGLGE